MNGKIRYVMLSLIIIISIFFILLLNPTWFAGKSDKTSSDDLPQNENPFPSATSSVDVQNKKIVIGASFLGLNEFPSAIMKKMIREAEEKNAELIVYDGKDSLQQQIANIKDMIEKKVDIIVLNPVDADKSAICVDLAEQAGIPVLGVNAVVTSDKLLTYVGSNDLEAGEIEMKFMAERIKGEGNIVVMDGVTGQSSQIQRTQGILNILRGYPNIKILEEKSGNWSREGGYALMKEWFKKYGNKINAVVSHNDEMALGAIKYLEEEKILGTIPIVGIDAIPDAVKAVEEGKLDATVFQDAEGQGKLAVDLAIKILKKESVAKTYYIPFRLVTRENIRQFTENR